MSNGDDDKFLKPSEDSEMKKAWGGLSEKFNKIYGCLFCDRADTEKHRIIVENELFYARWDNFPVTQGHAEIVPKRHIESFFELNAVELWHLYILILSVKVSIQETFHPDGFNIGINEGEAAARTIHHLHVHIIPRYKGDVLNPKGGVRNIISEKGDYTKENQKDSSS